jgi:hypothetical protein
LIPLPKMRVAQFFVAAALTVVGVVNADPSPVFPLTPNLISLQAPEGQKMLAESAYKGYAVDYFPISLNWENQIMPLYGGVATAACLLNALYIPRPIQTPQLGKEFGAGLEYFTQRDFFDIPEAVAVVNATVVNTRGNTLAELAGLVNAYGQSRGVTVTTTYGSAITLQKFRKVVKQNMSTKKNFMGFHYLRAGIQQIAGGHMSPIAAYHPQTDRILIMDVNKPKYPPVWVKTEEFYNSLLPIDTLTNKTRGFIEVSIA